MSSEKKDMSSEEIVTVSEQTDAPAKTQDEGSKAVGNSSKKTKKSSKKKDAIQIKNVIAIALVAVIIISLILCLTLCGRSGRSYDKDEVEAAAKELLPDALTLYSLYYGSGLGYMSTGYSDGDYREADPMSLHKYGFSTLEELKTMTKKVFSVSYSENIFNKYLESYEANDIVYSYARYTENATGDYILVYKDHDPIFDDRMSYKLDTVNAYDSTKDFINLTVNAVVSNADGDSKEITLKFTMYEERTGWRISSPCFGNYTSYSE